MRDGCALVTGAGGGWGTPDDVAGAVSYLVSEGAGFVSGQRIVVNGGFHFV